MSRRKRSRLGIGARIGLPPATAGLKSIGATTKHQPSPRHTPRLPGIQQTTHARASLSDSNRTTESSLSWGASGQRQPLRRHHHPQQRRRPSHSAESRLLGSPVEPSARHLPRAGRPPGGLWSSFWPGEREERGDTPLWVPVAAYAVAVRNFGKLAKRSHGAASTVFGYPPVLHPISAAAEFKLAETGESKGGANL
jgi:hypothetical protein